MAKTEDFLIEIGTEELPPNDLQNLVNAFADGLKTCFTEHNIEFAANEIKTFATPRRLAVLVPHVSKEQPEQLVERRGPAYTAAFTADGTPTKAGLGFAESCGVDIKQLAFQETDKGKWLYFKQTVPGAATIDLLANFVQKSLTQLPIKKRMRWGKGDFLFVRPVQWVLMLFGKQTIKASFFGVESGDCTYGHRIHKPEPIKITEPKDYAESLEQQGFVIADFAERRNKIEQQIFSLGAQENGVPVIDQNLLDLVTGLVEYPVPLLANFDSNFLRVPKECLISAMQDHQKCFPLLGRDEKLLPKFILISNLDSSDPKTVIRGNELVMHARLADAAFHFDNDQKQTLESRVEKLKTIIYQKQLGSLYDKIVRIEKLSAIIAEKIKANVEQTKRAAHLCKADLVTSMVYEFPELQGIMGYYYALHDGEANPVAVAIKDHYKPKSANDTLPNDPVSIALGIADRVDTLVGFFGIGNIPTGEKDPFALRRQALAIIRILIEKEVQLPLRELFVQAGENFSANIQLCSDELIIFCYDRMRYWYLNKGIDLKYFNAVLAIEHDNFVANLLIFDRRLKSVINFIKKSEAKNLISTHKRIKNTLKNLDPIFKHQEIDTQDIDQGLLHTTEETQLYKEITAMQPEIKLLLQNDNYDLIFEKLGLLQTPIDNFYANVMVNDKIDSLRNNRLRLVNNVNRLFCSFVDISLL